MDYNIFVNQSYNIKHDVKEAEMKKYLIVPTNKQLRIIHKHWKTLRILQDQFYKNVMILESYMEQETKIRGIEFFRSDDGYVGVGNTDKTMALIHGEDLE